MKMKKFVAGIMAFCVVVGAMPANTVNFFDNSIVTSAEELGFLTYKKYSDHVAITDCKSTAIKVDIPAEIDGLPVTDIDDYAFNGCSTLKLLTIPESVTSIGGNAFYRCSSLTEITIPNSVRYIGLCAFCGCSSLTEIIIPDSVTQIAEEAFYECSSLTEITILNPYTEIDSLGIAKKTVIKGYEYSTAQGYAEKEGYEFESLGEITETTTTTTATTTKATTTTTTTTVNKTDILLGDANCDGEINMADVASIIQHIGNKDTYALSEQGAVNADCDSQEGITGNDALAVQLLLAKQIDKLPYTE